MRRVTLTQFLIEQQRAGRTNPDLRLLIEVVARAIKAIAVNVSKGALAGVLGEAGTDNVQGEAQKKLDVIANEILLQANEWGGHLAAMMYVTDWRARGFAAAPFAGAVSLSGVHDLTPLVLYSLNVDFRLDDAEARRLSPVHAEPQTGAPLLAAVGADETSEFVRQSQLMWDAWPRNRPAGMQGILAIPQRHHFNVVLDYTDPASALTQATLALLAARA